MCEYCNGRRVRLGTLGEGSDEYATEVEFTTTYLDTGYIAATWYLYEQGAEGVEESFTAHVNYCPWCGRRLTKEEDM